MWVENISLYPKNNGRGMIDIPNYKGVYKINKFGEVYSINKKRLLKPYVSKRGYEVVTLNKKQRPIHQLIAETFLDINYKEKGFVVDHIDRNKTNNVVGNLRLVNKAENYYNSDYYNGRKKGYLKQRSSGSWNVIITLKGIRYDKTFKDKKEAIIYLTDKVK